MSERSYTEKQLSEVVANSTSITQVIRCLGLKTVGDAYKRIGNAIKELQLNTSHFNKQDGSKFIKYTKAQFINAVADSFSTSQALKKLNVKPFGGNYAVFNKYVKELKLDTSHFTKQGWSKGKTIGPKVPIEIYLNNEKPIGSNSLKEKLLKFGLLKRQCSLCQNIEWFGKAIPIELHHIDGNNKNNNLANLQILCPNCHTFTDNYRGKNIGKCVSS